jgi:hypothetical protein
MQCLNDFSRYMVLLHMTKENKKTALKTIRLSKSLDELLQKDEKTKRISEYSMAHISSAFQ